MKAALLIILWRGATALGSERDSLYKIKMKTITLIPPYHLYTNIRLYKTRSHFHWRVTS